MDWQTIPLKVRRDGYVDIDEGCFLELAFDDSVEPLARALSDTRLPIEVQALGKSHGCHTDIPNDSVLGEGIYANGFRQRPIDDEVAPVR